MKIPSWKLQLKIALTTGQKDLLLGLLLVLLVAGAYYAQWAYSLSFVVDSKVNVFNPSKYFWWANDSHEYRDTADWLYGRPVNGYIERRPWLYPALAGFARAAFDEHAEAVLWASQIAMWLASTAFLYLALHRATGSIPLSLLGAAVFTSHPSVLVLTFHGMTETLNILLLSILVWLLAGENRKRLLYALLVFSLLAVTKPTYQLQLTLLGAYFLARNWKLPKWKLAGLLALALVPVWIQLGLTAAHSGRPALSNIGGDTFEKFFVAVVHAKTEGLEWRESLAAIEGWEAGEQLAYLGAHPRETILTYRDNLVDRNLWIGSYFIRGEEDRMIGFAQSFNAASLYLHLLMLPLAGYYLLSPAYRQDKELLAVVYLTFLVQTLVTGISTGQEDRLIITGVPLWIFTYLVTARGLLSPGDPGGA